MAITLRNASTSTVSLYVPAIKMNRELTPGRRIPVSQEEYEELTFDPGFMALVRGHYIVIEGLNEGQQVAEICRVSRFRVRRHQEHHSYQYRHYFR